jgi:hypothetical protein
LQEKKPSRSFVFHPHTEAEEFKLEYVLNPIHLTIGSEAFCQAEVLFHPQQ